MYTYNLPWDEVLGSVEDFMAGFGGLVSATKAQQIEKKILLV